MRETEYRKTIYVANETLEESECDSFHVDFSRIIRRYRNEFVIITYGTALKDPEPYGFKRDDIKAFCGSEDGFTIQIGCKYYIFINEKMPMLRKNFTFAHELGHVILQHPCHINILAMTREELLAPEGDYCSFENETNSFARNQLCPVYAVKNYLQEKHIKPVIVNGSPIFDDNVVQGVSENFGISHDAAKVRMGLFQNDCYHWYGEW